MHVNVAHFEHSQFRLQLLQAHSVCGVYDFKGSELEYYQRTFRVLYQVLHFQGVFEIERAFQIFNHQGFVNALNKNTSSLVQVRKSGTTESHVKYKLCFLSTFLVTDK